MRPDDSVYRGERPADGSAVRVTVDGVPLSPRPSWQLRAHSPIGFEWGYGGSGPAQLALALVYDATGDPALSLRCYQWFKWAVVSGWGPAWAITAGRVREWLDQFEREDRPAARVMPAAEARTREGGAR